MKIMDKSFSYIINWLQRQLNNIIIKKLYYAGNNIKLWKGVIIHSPEKVTIGSNTGIGDYVVLWGGGGIEIGENVLIATHSVITSQGHSVNANVFRETNVMNKVIIKNNVWIGAGVLIMPGVTIGENTVIGAGSVVTKDIPANSIAIGSPAIVVKNR